MTKFIGSRGTSVAHAHNPLHPEISLLGFKGGTYAQLIDANGDVVLCNGGDDLLYTASGNDKLDGGDGNDQVLGGDGNDVLNPGRSAPDAFGFRHELIVGGNGDDTINVREPSSRPTTTAAMAATRNSSIRRARTERFTLRRAAIPRTLEAMRPTSCASSTALPGMTY